MPAVDWQTIPHPDYHLRGDIGILRAHNDTLRLSTVYNGADFAPTDSIH